ncbi:SDR family oxidoreductase [Salibacterium salarium]|uniref:SDR family oxidoreductase n=1 Tax=Salibacterium salarium TaxID=284579 RepID=A0A3R9P8P4_9BACI|nr:SDR family oxidoreductase [Salibacterium salarium]RSL32797.1 SDR family oxidoreductase [Salibacterium salarium]
MNGFTLITGASGAIGGAIALSLAEEGHSLFLHYHRSEQAIMKLKAQCEALGVEAYIVQSDLSKREGVEQLYNQLHSPVETIVYNCGTQNYGFYQDNTDDELYELAHIHLLNAMLLVKKLIPSMITQKRGQIVMISSIWGDRGAALEAAYSAMKGGINTFVKALAKETAPSNIRVNAVAPGVIDTPMMENFSEDVREQLREDIPSGRLGTVDEVADAVNFLIGEKARYINGHILDINGGW